MSEFLDSSRGGMFRIAETSKLESVQTARAAYEKARRKEQYFFQQRNETRFRRRRPQTAPNEREHDLARFFGSFTPIGRWQR
jgi:hypothetical protein